MSNMEIKVTSCADCPFSANGQFICKAMEPSEIVLVFAYNKEFHPSCPLKQQSITVKLDQEYQKQKEAK